VSGVGDPNGVGATGDVADVSIADTADVSVDSASWPTTARPFEALTYEAPAYDVPPTPVVEAPGIPAMSGQEPVVPALGSATLATASAGPDLPRRIAALEALLALAGGRLSPEAVTRTTDVVERVRTRMSLSPEHVVAALAGSTGSGKSSLFNALIRFELSPVGVVRPTTLTGLACVWDPERAPGAAALLDRVGVDERRRTLRGSLLDGAHRQAEPELAPLVLIDLPDHDSAVRAHREETDRAAATADLVVFVTDPQKYADAAWHERYLRKLTRHQDALVVVLNKIDELAPADARACAEDCARLLRESGLDDVPLLVTSTRTGQGLGDLRSLMAARIWRKQAAMVRSGADVERCVALLAEELRPRPTPGSGDLEVDREVDVDGPGAPAGQGAADGRDAALRQIGEGTGMQALSDLVDAAYRRRASAVTGWPIRHGVMALRSRLHGDSVGEYAPWTAPIADEPAPPPVQRSDVESAVGRAVDAAAAPLPEPWAREMRRIADSCVEELTDTLDATLAGTEVGPRLVPYWWTGVQVTHWMLLTAALVGFSGTVAYVLIGGDSSLPDTSPLPFPALVAVLALVLGATLDVASHVGAARAAVKLRTRVTARMTERVHSAADQLLFLPLAAERGRYDRALEHLGEAAEPMPGPEG
jgi:GTPase Era involved in 16S rRNA processing